jgi:hypothetical protein
VEVNRRRRIEISTALVKPNGSGTNFSFEADWDMVSIHSTVAP